MIREISQCPYCNSVLAIDDDQVRIVHDPDRPWGIACPHLTFAAVGLTFQNDGDIALQDFDGIFVRGEGWGSTAQKGALGDYVVELVGDHLLQDQVPQVEHRVVGATAGQREGAAIGTGVFLVRYEGTYLAAILDACGLYFASTFCAVGGGSQTYGGMSPRTPPIGAITTPRPPYSPDYRHETELERRPRPRCH